MHRGQPRVQFSLNTQGSLTSVGLLFFGKDLEVSEIMLIFANRMLTRQECIDTIKANAETIVQQFDVRSLRLFGSLARNEQHESSDIDVCVEMPPDMFQLIGLKQYLEELMGCDVDVVRIHRNIDDFLLNQIKRDGIYIIGESSNRGHRGTDLK